MTQRLPDMKRFLPTILAILLFASVFGLASGQVEDNDTFWQLQSGRYMVESGKLIYQDTFTLDAAAPRWEHCWLHDLILYETYQLGGFDGIALLRGLVVATAAVFLFLAARVRGAGLVSTLLVLPLLFAKTHMFWRARPQLWTILAFCLFLLILEGCRNQRCGRYWLWTLPLITLFWANLHAGVILVAPLMAAYGVGLWLNGYRRRFGLQEVPSAIDRSLLWVCGLIGLALLATPYFDHTYRALAGIMEARTSPMTVGNDDWRPNNFAGNSFYYYVAVASLTIMATSFRRICFVDALLLGGLFYSGVYYERNSLFFLFACIVVVPRYLEELVAWIASLHKTVAVVYRAVAITATFVLAAMIFDGLHERYGFFARGIKAHMFPVKAAEFVRQEQLPPNLFNSYVAGGYLMWSLYPQYQVFWDPRQDSKRMHNAGQIITAGLPGFQVLLDHYRVNTLVVLPLNLLTGKRTGLLDALDEQVWSLVFADELYLVYVRNTAVEPGWLARRRLPKRAKEAAILRMANVLGSDRPRRTAAYWEAARVYFLWGDVASGRKVLDNYFYLVPPESRDPEAVAKYDEILRGENM